MSAVGCRRARCMRANRTALTRDELNTNSAIYRELLLLHKHVTETLAELSRESLARRRMSAA
jgi:hypothetical protein